MIILKRAERYLRMCGGKMMELETLHPTATQEERLALLDCAVVPWVIAIAGIEGDIVKVIETAEKTS